jgi:hypothetical protein
MEKDTVLENTVKKTGPNDPAKKTVQDHSYVTIETTFDTTKDNYVKTGK